MQSVLKTSAKVACIAALVTVTGCETVTGWLPGRSKNKNPPAELVEFKSTMGVKTAWQASVGASERFIFSPALVGDDIIAAGADGKIVRLNAASGKQLWSADAGVRLTAGVGADAKTIVVAGDKGALIAFDENGKQRWKVQATSEVLSAPAVAGNVIVVRSIDNRIAGYDTETGARKWIVQRTIPALTLRSAPGITLFSGAAFVGVPGGRLVALDLKNGNVLWEATIADPKGATELERVADATGAPLIVGREICSVAFQGKVACFDIQTGQSKWSKDASSDVGIGIDERFVFVADEKGNVSALSRDGGTSVWRNTKLGFRRLSAPFSWGRAVVVGDAQGYLHFLSREDGAFISRVKVDRGAFIGAPVLAGSTLIYQTQGGAIVALTAD